MSSITPPNQSRPAGSLRANFIANLCGRGWVIVANLVFLPVYVQFLGVEAYGLVGAYTTLLAVLAVAGLGLNATLSRETARLSSRPEDGQDLVDTVRTIEIAYCIPVTIVATVLLACAAPLAVDWFREASFSELTVIRAVRLMALAVGCQFVINLYEGGLMGLEQQVLMNGVRFLMGLVQSVGSVLLLWLVSPTIEMFFVWQVVTTGIYALLLRSLVWNNLPTAQRRPRFRMSVLSRVWRYSAAMVGLSLTAVVITQTDKIVVSRVLPLGALGIYTIAWTLARAPLSIVSPAHQAFFPRLTRHATSHNSAAAAALFHQASQLVSVMALPCVAMLVFNARSCLHVWLGGSVDIEPAVPVLALLAIGTGAQAVSQVPHTLQLAHGWPMLSVWLNTSTAILSVPLTIVLTSLYGVTGAALAWAILSVGIASLATALILRRFLVGQGLRWLFRDVLAPALAASIPIIVVRFAVPPEALDSLVRPVLFVYLVGVWLTASAAAAMAAPQFRSALTAAVHSSWNLGRTLLSREPGKRAAN